MGNLPLLDDTSPAVLAHLVTQGMLEREDGMLFIGPMAERLFGRRYFRELTSSFTADPEFTVLLCTAARRSARYIRSR